MNILYMNIYFKIISGEMLPPSLAMFSIKLLHSDRVVSLDLVWRSAFERRAVLELTGESGGSTPSLHLLHLLGEGGKVGQDPHFFSDNSSTGEEHTLSYTIQVT